MFRKIDNKPNWDNFISGQPLGWLNQGDVPGDLLKDLKTEGNELSVYKVDDNHSNLEKIISAMAANRKYLKPLYYFLIERESIIGNNYSLADAVGKTLSDEVNINYHTNIEKLSGFNVVKLAKIFSEKSEIINSEIIIKVRPNEVLKIIINSIKKKEYSIDRLGGDLKEQVEEVMRAMN